MQPDYSKPAVKQMVGSTATGDYPCRSKISDLISVLSFRRTSRLLAKSRQDSKGNGVQRQSKQDGRRTYMQGMDQDQLLQRKV